MHPRLLPLLFCGACAFVASPAHAALGNITFQFAAGVLTLTSPSDPIVLSCLGGNVAVNGEVPVEVPVVSCAAVQQLVVTGTGAGDNLVDLAPLSAATYPALAQVSVDGGGGNDTLIGSFLADTLHGGEGNDSIDGNNNPPATVDAMFGDAGDDTLIWNPGKNDDLNEGGDGNDTSVINGGGAAEVFAATVVAGRVRFERTNNPFFVDIGSTERLVLNANGGDDQFSGGAGLAALIALEVNGGDGNDTIIGGDGADVLRGGPGNDTIDGNDNPLATVDSMFGDAGDDTLIWNPGKDDDLNEGGDGNDTSVVNGGGGAEVFSVNAVAGRVRLERTINNGAPAPFFVDIGSTERLLVNANNGDDQLTGGAGLAALIALEVDGGDGNDTITGGDGADVLRGGPGNDIIDGNDNPVATVDAMFGDAGDDTLIWNPGKDDDRNDGGDGNDLSLVNGGGGAEAFAIAPNGARVLLQRTTNNGAPAPFFVDIGGTERLRVNGNGGDDAIVASAGLAASIALELDGGDGNDTITGGDGADLLRGGAGNDTLQPGENPVATVDEAFGGAGDDLFVWNPGEDDDEFDGEDGNDTTLVNAAGANEHFRVFAEGDATRVERVLPTRFTVDSRAIESLQLNTAGGDDLVETELLFDVEQRLDGGTAITAQGDRVTVLGFDGDARFSPILTPHFGAVLHTGFESQDALRSGGSFTAALSGTQEVPPVAGNGEGRGLIVLSPREDEIQVTLSFAGLGGNSTQAHLHGPAPAGANAAPIFDLPGTGAAAGQLGPFRFAVTPAQVQQLRDALWYFNVHSSVAASGEIRGQALTDLVLRAPLEARQVFPASTSTARGYATATLAGTLDEVRTTLAFAGLVGEADPGSNSANLVRGPAARRQNGAIVAAVTLPASNQADGAFVSGAIPLTPDEAQQLRDGRWYFEVQSLEFPQGELRGQITQSLHFDDFE